jgi:hypothetical protein
VGRKAETWKRQLLDGKCGKTDTAKKERKTRKKRRKVNNAFQVIW